MRWQRFALLLVLNLALQAVLVAANGYLARWSLHLHLDVLFLILAGLYFPSTPAFLAVVVHALFVEAWWPLPAGLLASVYGGVMLILLSVRGGLRRDYPVHVALVAVACNAVILAALTWGLGTRGSDPGLYLLRIAFDGTVSTLVVLLILPRFLQAALLLFRLAGEDLTAAPPPR